MTQRKKAKICLRHLSRADLEIACDLVLDRDLQLFPVDVPGNCGYLRHEGSGQAEILAGRLPHRDTVVYCGSYQGQRLYGRQSRVIDDRFHDSYPVVVRRVQAFRVEVLKCLLDHLCGSSGFSRYVGTSWEDQNHWLAIVVIRGVDHLIVEGNPR